MRRLIYIPIIHTEKDLGSLAHDIEKRSRKVVKASSFREHKRIVNNYWDEIDRYWQKRQVSGFKVFQDGIAANGMLGQKIVNDLARKGSTNYKIIKQLVKRGAILTKTEDADLIKKEYFLTKELSERKSLFGSLFSLLRYKLGKGRLLTKRDDYIARRIDENLQEGETGICFLGVYHKMIQKLPPDFTIVYLKDPKKVKEYYQRLTSHSRNGEINRLARWLVKPIKIPLGRV